MPVFKNKNALKAVYIGTLCAVAYLAVYFARNVLSAVTPQMIADGVATTEYIGSLSSVFFMTYAVGQLINGLIGDKIKAKYMIGLGLALAGIVNILFVFLLPVSPASATVAYALTGFFLSMIYGPMTKVVAENTEPPYTTRCSLGYTFSSFLGTPMAGVVAAVLAWQGVFISSGAFLIVMGFLVFLVFTLFERKGFVKYNLYINENKQKGKLRTLIERGIIKFTVVSIVTGVIRTTVVFWMPTYISEHLGFSPKNSALIFTVASLVISSTAFVSIFLYEKLGYNLNLTLFIEFLASAVFFALTYFVENPIVNICLLVLAVLAGDGAATMLWSRYCPSLRDTGMVSGATGFLDFVSYMAASISSTIFANAVSDIGWGNLILIWCGLMVIGVAVSIPSKKNA